MSKEWTFILNILTDFLYGRLSNPNVVDWNAIYDISEKHQITSIIYYQCKKELGKYPKYRSAFARDLYLDVQRTEAIKEFEKIAKDYNYVFFKGPVVAQNYNIPALRTMGDVDVFLDTVDRERIHNLLLNNGFKLKYKEDNEHGTWNYLKNKISFELHDKLIHPNLKDDLIYSYYDNPWDYVRHNRFNNSYHFLYLVVHLREHFLECGVGLRQFFDIAILTMRDKELDWEWIYNTAKILNINVFLNRILYLNERWFEVESPVILESVDDNFYINATEKIFTDGVFGYNNEENELIPSMIIINNEGKIGVFNKFVRDIFIPYSELKQIQEYQFVQGRKALVPVAWVYRIILKWKERDSIKRRYFIDDEMINKRNNMLKQWGL